MYFVTRLAYHNNGEVITEMAPAQCLGCVFSLHLFLDEPGSEQLPLSSAVASHVGNQPTNQPTPCAIFKRTIFIHCSGWFYLICHKGQI
jgi:hypothetical protein